MTTDAQSSIIMYQSPDGTASLEVRLDHETAWLTQAQLAELFGVQVPAINKHLKNIFSAGELVEEAVISILETTAADGKKYRTRYYNLDAIIAVGYRVNSYQATRFRQWATHILRDHIVQGYTINEQRFRDQAEKLTEMRRTVELLARTLANQELVSETGKDVLRVITDYAYALTLLDRYDHGTLTIGGITRQGLHIIGYDEVIGIVAVMKGEFDGLFGIEKDQGFKSALGTIYQTFGGDELYPSVEEKGANLLYSLVALTLLIAESRPDEKETIVKVIVNLINRKND